MIELVSVLIGIICGGGSGFIIGRFTNLQKIRQLQDVIFAQNRQLDAVGRRLQKLTSRDELGRFIGGKKK